MVTLRNILRLLFLLALTALILALFGQYPVFSMKGDIESATITKRGPAATGEGPAPNDARPASTETTLTVTAREELDAISRPLRVLWRPFVGVNSFVGRPKYRLRIQYKSGATDDFSFTRTEWGARGFTPPGLVPAIENLLSNRVDNAAETRASTVQR